MGIFYHPPPPAGRSAITPPEPHVPIGTQGNQPPRYTTALMVVAVLASWPADLEPRLTRPNEQQQKIAPLTLKYGQQPTPQGPITPVEYSKFVASWPPDLEPRLGRPNNQQQTIAPLTLAYGDQPTRQAAVSPLEMAQIAGTWVQTWDAQRAPSSTSWAVPPPPVFPVTPLPALIWTAWSDPDRPPPRPVTIAPLTLPSGDPPPRVGTAVPAAVALLTLWPADLEPRLGVPNQQQQHVAPLTLSYGDPPQPQAPLSVGEFAQIVNTWEPAWRPPPAALWTVQGTSGDVTVSLTGVSATGSVGTLAPETATSPLGVDEPPGDGTFVLGSFFVEDSLVAPSTAVPLTGLSSTGSVGSVTHGGVLVALTGLSSTGSVGTVSETHSGSLALSGLSSTGSIGSLTPQTDVGLTSALATGTVGTITETHPSTVALSGVSATGALGLVSETHSGSAAITGVSTTSSLGSVVAGPTQALTGVSATGSVGTITTSGGHNPNYYRGDPWIGHPKVAYPIDGANR